MRTTCLINNYNYAQYVSEAIESALNQSVSFDEIIVVDDASTDDSRTVLQQGFSNHPAVKLLLKAKNGGQLSCFNEGFLMAAGDLIFFLDADDTYKPNYLEEALKIYQTNSQCDFLFCSHEKIGSKREIFHTYREDRALGRSTLLTLYAYEWIGDVTSTLSMTRDTLSQILPFNELETWRVRADSCLVFGASIVGSRKFYLAQPLVNYRIHSKNNYHDRQKTSSVKRNLSHYDFCMARAQFFTLLEKKMNYDRDRLSRLAHLEFISKKNPYREELLSYIRLVLGLKISFFFKVKMILVMLKHFFI